MLKRGADLTSRLFRHKYGITLAAFLVAAILTGAFSVVFMRAFEIALSHRLDFATIGSWCWLTTPLLFIASAELIRRAAPNSAGSGIPQAIFAASELTPATEQRLQALSSFQTMAVKFTAVLIGIVGGASIGREGPTVHIAMCVFMLAMGPFRRWAGVKVDPGSMVIAGSAAGLAAAFNTPLAGVTFAIEELSVDIGSSIKEYVLMAIIVAAITAQAMYGEYAYFGQLSIAPTVPLTVTLVISVIAGLAGAFFSTAILRGQRFFARFNSGPSRYLAPMAAACGLLTVAYFAGTQTLGPGNEVSKGLTHGDLNSCGVMFPLAKMATTLLSYWSGIAGGIFAPCLSAGSALGGDVARFMGAPIESCALIGMAALLSGTIQAPITSFVIIFEMTGRHEMLVPIMLGSLLAFMTSRLTGADHLYKTLAKNYGYLLPEKTDSGR